LAGALQLRVVLALLHQGVLDLEQVGEVSTGVDADEQVDRLVVVVEEGQFLAEPVADRAPADHRELRVDVHRAGAGDQEEPRLEVVEIVDGQRTEPLAVDREYPGRDVPGVEREETGRVGGRRVDVTTRVADHERVPLQDLDKAIGHHITCSG
jgi:hypothetical protein